MPETGVAGSFSQENEESDAPARRTVGAPRPAHCKQFARARFARALPDIMEKLLAEVLAGNVPHLKVLMELTGLDKPDPPRRTRKPKEKSLEAILLEQWRKDGEDEALRLAAEKAADEALQVEKPASGM